MSSAMLDERDGRRRCAWACGDSLYLEYHDREWGRPVADDVRLFEKICLEGFQAGLSWLTILRKRENFRAAFAGFDFGRIASFGDQEVVRLLKNDGIVRNRAKIVATIHNAARALELAEEFGSLAAYFWSWEPAVREPEAGKVGHVSAIPSVTKTSQALSKDLKNRGWKFVGPTTVYAFMQAMGMVNDHLDDCFCRDEVERLRRDFKRPGRSPG